MTAIPGFRYSVALAALAALCATAVHAGPPAKKPGAPGRTQEQPASPMPAVGGVADYYGNGNGAPPASKAEAQTERKADDPLRPPPCDRNLPVCERLSWVEQVLSSRDLRRIPHLRAVAVEDAHERIRGRSLGALVILGDAGASALFAGRLAGDPSPAVRRAAAEGIGLLRFMVPPDRLALPLAGDPDPLVRAECARAIGRIGSAQAGPTLTAALLQDASPEVRALSAEALAVLRTQWGTDILKQAAAQDKSPIVRLYAIRGLADFAPFDSVPLFREVWDGSDDHEARIEAFRGLLRSGEGAKWIEKGLADRDDRVRFLSLRELLARAPIDPKRPLARSNPSILRAEKFLSDSSRGIRELAKVFIENQGHRVRASGFIYVMPD